ncbi:hypothetical protein Taro_002029 [Colocasia esculenta]|uniref:Uncharacterized protein n=1 Tax=Colocasia esculenta TaxID=4460 RepID=A0A843TJN7_COLES|nr:hypothetical protein [Colocasia esculenta]
MYNIQKGHTPRTCKAQLSSHLATRAHNAQISLLLTTHGATAASATRTTPSSRDDEPLVEGSREETTLESCKARNTYSMVLLSSGREQYNATTTNQGRGTHTTPAEINGVRHKAEVVLSTPAETMEQPSENDVSPQARPPQTSTRSRAHK